MLRRADYRPPDWLVPEADLDFDIRADRVRVRARLEVVRNGTGPLRLDGEALRLVEVRVDGRPAAHKLDKTGLTIRIKSDAAVIETVVEIAPGREQLGLFALDGLLCSQCEPEGFRRITFFPDRPDVLTRWRVRVEADAAMFPVLLSNGNPLGAGALPEGRHWAAWDDPFPRPCYLFALVAGALHATPERIGETDVTLWTREQDPPAAHALAALHDAMAWDAENFGRRYDFEMLNLVAVRGGYAFGAVEAKGLNIFDAALLLPDPAIATDAELEVTRALVAHEYLHNWSGNRVTIRDWFELALKEGLTVYREQAFCAGAQSPGVKRIQDIRAFRATQAAGGGPDVQSPRPEACGALGELYSAAVYVKGAELVQMLAALAGPEAFRTGLARYFDKCDGSAARFEDLIAAIGVDQPGFVRWLGHVGTPAVEARVEHDPASRTATVTIVQQEAEPLVLPLRTALFGTGGKQAERLLVATEREQSYRFENIAEPPLLSINRGFSAPVEVTATRDAGTLAWLARHDDDPVARWEAMQELMLAVLMRGEGGAGLIEALRHLLAEGAPDYVAEVALLPAQSRVAERTAPADPGAIHAAWLGLRRTIGQVLAPEWRAALDGAPDTMGGRALRGLALDYLVAGEAPDAAALALATVVDGANMTERVAALRALADSDAPERAEALAAFHAKWRGHAPLLDKWFSIQALSARSDTVQTAPRLLTHPDFTLAHPTRLDAVAGAFAANQQALHHASGRGYAFLADVALAADRIDTRTAQRLVRALLPWRRFEAGRAAMMRGQLERIAGAGTASDGVRRMARGGLG